MPTIDHCVVVFFLRQAFKVLPRELFDRPRRRWGPLMATALLAALPVVLLYLMAQRQLMSAFATSGIR